MLCVSSCLHVRCDVRKLPSECLMRPRPRGRSADPELETALTQTWSRSADQKALNVSGDCDIKIMHLISVHQS